MANRLPNPQGPSPPYRRTVDDWEEWEDDDIVTPIEPDEQVLIEPPPPARASSSLAPKSSSRLSARYPSSKLKRMRSRQRQKAQNAKAGIKLITDMASMRPRGHLAHQLRTPDGRPVKFVDAAALQALEGEPSSASVGNWNWLKKKSPASATPKSSARTPDREISPEDRAIPIGFAFPTDEMAGHDISPHTAVVATPQTPAAAQGPHVARPPRNGPQSSASPEARTQQASMWSPDTPDTASSLNSPRAQSSVYSQATASHAALSDDAPPVPALPAGYKKTPHQRLISLELGAAADDDDAGTPCTLFEEDGIPSPLKVTKPKGSAVTPDSAGSASRGWWDHVVTPFMDKRLTFSSRKQRLESPKEEAEGEPRSGGAAKESRSQNRSSRLSPIMVQAPIVRAPTPRRTPSPPQAQPSELPSSRSSPELGQTITEEKPQIVVTDDAASDRPPPYSPPKTQTDAPVRYRAVFPPGHPLHAQFPPSPGPASPGLAATMTSQGATQMTEIPITPTAGSGAPPAHAPLPMRPVGTALPQEHSHDARGSAKRVERERRRNEKEEVVARRVGGLWRGRGCIPESGCFGRGGREGRKRRRIWMGVAGGILALIILIIVLAVVLTRPHHAADAESIWVNLTDYPPMPTGVMTVVGPDNTVARSGCTEPSTLWSCSLPKEEHDSVAPYKPNQPTVIMQIQWDNGTRETWNVPNGDPPASVSRRGVSAASYASSMVRSRETSDDFTPDPKAPDFQEMWFLGETTDNITSKEKAGEPTPFYISLLKSANETVGNPTLDKRQGTELGNTSLSEILPPPDLAEDGTPAPAAMLPQATQQPVRLFDRGLATEHYGFYAHFKRTLFLKSVTVLDGTADQDDDGDVPLDQDGGCAKTEADFLATWAETRVLVRIWTRTLDANTSALLGPDGGGGGGERELVRPGSMPYPVTVTLDTHGGDPQQKLVWEWPMDDRQKLDVDEAKLLANDMGEGGTWVNPRGSGDDKFGGFDGGTGGCKCEWVNWV